MEQKKANIWWNGLSNMDKIRIISELYGSQLTIQEIQENISPEEILRLYELNVKPN